MYHPTHPRLLPHMTHLRAWFLRHIAAPGPADVSWLDAADC